MIRMRVAEVPGRGTTGPAHTATAAWDGHDWTVASRSEPTCKLARVLVAAGCPDEPWEAVQDGTVTMRGRSLHRWSRLTVVEDDRHGPRFVRYQPMPEGLRTNAGQGDDVSRQAARGDEEA